MSKNIKRPKIGEKGFSLIEVLIAIVIITAGLIALSGALVLGVTLPQRARQQEIAKQLANSTMETIIAAKEASRPGFNSFDSFSYTANGGRFVSGVTSVLTAGPDGVFGTCDDGTSGAFNATCGGQGADIVSVDIDPGRDGIYATKTGANGNKTNFLLTFTRQITIDNLTPAPVTSKQITVDIFYNTPTGGRQMYRLVCQLSNFRTL